MNTPYSCPVSVLLLRDAATVYGGNDLLPATESSAGLDLRACIETDDVTIPAGERCGIACGIAIEPRIPGVAGFVYSRSGLGAVKGITVAQGVGVIDPDYRGEIMVFLLNTSPQPYKVRRGDRVAQLIFQPYLRPEFTTVAKLGETARGAGGFGHTGNK